jgi:hypothetical protein
VTFLLELFSHTLSSSVSDNNSNNNNNNISVSLFLGKPMASFIAIIRHCVGAIQDTKLKQKVVLLIAFTTEKPDFFFNS